MQSALRRPLLQDDDLRLEAVYIGDLEDPTPWMVPGSLLLTTGPTFASDPESAPRLVRLLKKSGAIGVGVAITPHVDEIPQDMVDEAEAVGLPLLRIPPETPFRTITSYVFTALTSRDMHRLRRSLALQNQLLQVLLEEHGVEGLVRRLADFIAGDTILFDSHGNVLARSSIEVPASGDELATRVWGEYHEVTTRGVLRSVLEVGEWRAHYREAIVEGAIERVLVALQPRAAVVSEYDEATLTFAQRLIEVELSTTRNLAGMRRRTRAGLLDMLVHGHGTAAELGERLLYHGIPPAQPWRILVVAAEPERRGAAVASAGQALAEALLDAVEHTLEEQDIPFLSLPLAGQVVLLIPLGDEPATADDRERLAKLSERVAMRLRTGCVRIGASEPLGELDMAPSGLAHARQCLEAMIHTPHPCGDVVMYEDLGLRAQVLDRLPDDVLRTFSAKVMGRLEEVDRREGSDLASTLERYLAHDCSVAASAQELFLHRNTLRKRLQRIERETGLDLAVMDDIVEAYLSVHAKETLGTRLT